MNGDRYAGSEQLCQRTVFKIGDDPFDDGVVVMGSFGVKHQFGAVDEHRLIPVGSDSSLWATGAGGGLKRRTWRTISER